jgi:hypothetical protein
VYPGANQEIGVPGFGSHSLAEQPLAGCLPAVISVLRLAPLYWSSICAIGSVEILRPPSADSG